MKKLITKIALWLLNKCHHQIPVIVENKIDLKDCQRIKIKKKIPQVMESMFEPKDFQQRVINDAKKELVEKLLSELKVFKRVFPEGTEIMMDFLWVQPCNVDYLEYTVINGSE